MTAAKASTGSPLWTFVLFALVGPVAGALILFVPNIPAFARWIAIDSSVWLRLIDLAILIYPLGIWPGLLAGAAVAWRDRANGGATLPFAIFAALVAGIVWLTAFDFLVVHIPGSLLSEINLLRLCACLFAGAFCWWLSRIKPADAA
jgi:hypothetical protein